MNDPTNLDELIAAERAKANARIAKLRRAAAAEQRRVDEKVTAILREQDAGLYERLASEARDALADEKTKRSSRAKKWASATPPVLDHGASRHDEHDEEVRHSWE